MHIYFLEAVKKPTMFIDDTCGWHFGLELPTYFPPSTLIPQDWTGGFTVKSFMGSYEIVEYLIAF